MKLDRNGYAPSIVRGYTKESEYTVRHEVYGGKNRKISKANGFWVALYPDQHQLIHENPNKGFDLWLKRTTQWYYEQDHSREDFIKLIGKNYLGDEPTPQEWNEMTKKPMNMCGAEKMAWMMGLI